MKITYFAFIILFSSSLFAQDLYGFNFSCRKSGENSNLFNISFKTDLSGRKMRSSTIALPTIGEKISTIHSMNKGVVKFVNYTNTDLLYSKILVEVEDRVYDLELSGFYNVSFHRLGTTYKFSANYFNSRDNVHCQLGTF